MPNSTASRVVSNGKKNNLLSREQVEFNLKARDIQADWTSHAAIELEVFRKVIISLSPLFEIINRFGYRLY